MPDGFYASAGASPSSRYVTYPATSWAYREGCVNVEIGPRDSVVGRNFTLLLNNGDEWVRSTAFASDPDFDGLVAFLLSGEGDILPLHGLRLFLDGQLIWQAVETD